MSIVRESEELGIWLHDKVNGISVPSHERGRVAASCFDVVLEHQHAVTILVARKLYGSAFALARSAYEAYIRGVWLRICASKKQIKKFLNEKLDLRIGELIEDIEKNDGYLEGVLSASKKSVWKVLNSFTHTGFNQIVRRNSDKYIEPNYSDEDIIQIVRFVNSKALLAGLELTFLSNNIELSKEFSTRIKEYAGSF